jgi:outer membrane protein assembly factor BamB
MFTVGTMGDPSEPGPEPEPAKGNGVESIAKTTGLLTPGAGLIGYGIQLMGSSREIGAALIGTGIAWYLVFGALMVRERLRPPGVPAITTPPLAGASAVPGIAPPTAPAPLPLATTSPPREPRFLPHLPLNVTRSRVGLLAAWGGSIVAGAIMSTVLVVWVVPVIGDLVAARAASCQTSQAQGSVPAAQPTPAQRAQAAMFRGNPARTGEVYATDSRQGWRFQTGEPVWSSPAIVGDIVVFGSNDGCLYAVDRASGERRWGFKATSAANAAGEINPTPPAVSSSPAIADGLVVAGARFGSIFALNAESGESVWTLETGSKTWNYSSPTIADGVVYIGSSNGLLYAIDLKSVPAKTLWSFRAKAGIWSSAIVDGDVIYIGDDSGHISAIDRKSTELLWEFETNAAVVSSPLIVGDTLFAGSHDTCMYAIDTGSHRKRWSFPTGGEIQSSPAISGSSLFFGSKDGTVYALEVRNGDLLWSFKTDGAIWSSPAVSANTVYITSDDGYLYALDATTGVQQSRALVASDEARLRVRSSPYSMRSSPALAAGIAYVGSYDGAVYAVATNAGSAAAHAVSSAPAAATPVASACAS